MLTIPRILVADDAPEVRRFLNIALKSLGFSVDAVENGEEALARVEGNGANYALLFLDLLMPGKGGLKTLREIRKLDTGLPSPCCGYRRGGRSWPGRVFGSHAGSDSDAARATTD